MFIIMNNIYHITVQIIVIYFHFVYFLLHVNFCSNILPLFQEAHTTVALSSLFLLSSLNYSEQGIQMNKRKKKLCKKPR